jgi:hypothetical protein
MIDLPTTRGKWVPIRNRRGTIFGWMEMFAHGGRWLTIPDSSRYIPNTEGA